MRVALRGRNDEQKQVMCDVAHLFSLRLQDFNSFGVFFFFLNSTCIWRKTPRAERLYLRNPLNFIHMFLHLTRLNDDTNQTIGRLVLKDDKGKTVFSMSTLELPWEHNITKQSCIPCGFYVVKKRYSWRFGLHLHIIDVTGRDLILIHSGNFKTDTQGCILVGDSLKYINNDGLLDVFNSKRTLKFLLEMMPVATTIKIVNAPNIWKV